MTKYQKKGWVSFAVCACAFIYLLKFTWLRWGDIIIDTGRAVYLPLRIYSGGMLYRDIFCVYGPFSPYLNAFLFKLFSPHLNVLILNGIITTALAGALIYKVSRIFLGIFYATFTVLTFLFVFAFGHYVYIGNYNFILPYSYGSIHSVTFALAALYFFYKAVRRGALNGYAYACAAAITLSALSKIEVGIALLLSINLAITARGVFLRGGFKKPLASFLVYFCLPVVAVVLIYALFVFPSFEVLKKTNLLDFLIVDSRMGNPLTLIMSGAYDAAGNAWLMLKVLLIYSLLSLFFIVTGLLVRYFWRLRLDRMIRACLSSAVILGAGFAVFIFFKKFLSYKLQFRPLPVICLFLIIVFIWEIANKRRAERAVLGLAIAFFSLFLVSRMFFAAWAGHYGFYLLVPGLAAYYIFFFHTAPGFLKPAPLKRIFRLGFLAVFVLFIFSHVSISRFCYQRRNLMVRSPGGSLCFFDNEKERRCGELVEFLQKNTAEGQTLVVMPEGLTVNFLSGRENPLYYYSYLPIDLSRPEIEESVVLSIEKEGIDYVALVQRDTREYGPVVFGRDYARQLFNYVEEKYFLYKQFGPFPYTSPHYGIALFKRKK